MAPPALLPRKADGSHDIAPRILLCSREHCLARKYWLSSVPGRSLQLTGPQATVLPELGC